MVHGVVVAVGEEADRAGQVGAAVEGDLVVADGRAPVVAAATVGLRRSVEGRTHADRAVGAGVLPNYVVGDLEVVGATVQVDGAALGVDGAHRLAWEACARFVDDAAAHLVDVAGEVLLLSA